MLEMLHIHIPFQCFLRPGPCSSEYLSLVVQDTGWARLVLSVGEYVFGIFMIFIRFHILTRNGAAQITDNSEPSG